jgi:hypothetical protein
MHKKLFLTCAAMAIIVGSVASHAATAITINYGVVENAVTTTEKSSHAGGALAGGLMGALIGPRRHRGLRMVAGAGIGAAIEGSSTGGTVQQYSVKLNSGGQTIISTELSDIRTGDCVSIETGGTANIRRVSSYHCEVKNTTSIPEHHKAAASNCDLAKNELAKAETDDAITNAAKKVRILCED